MDERTNHAITENTYENNVANTTEKQVNIQGLNSPIRATRLDTNEDADEIK